MTEPLRRRIEAELENARAWKRGADPAPVVSALGYALTLEALGLRELLPPRSAHELAALGREALLAWEPPSGEGEDADAERVAHHRVRDIARAGIAALSSRASERAARPRAHGIHPSSTALVRMLAGDLDGLSAGRYALHAVACGSCRAAVALLRDHSVARVGGREHAWDVAIAAAKPASVRAPAGGRVVGAREHPAVEAVLFDDADGRRLAVYARAQVPLRLVAAGVTTEETLAGYWIGRVESGVARIDATLHAGAEHFAWSLDLGD